MVTKERVLGGARMIASLGVAAICIVLLLGKLDAGVLATLPAQISQLSLLQICAAALATGVSFWAVGRYDVVTHRALATQITARRAQIAGTSAIALSQTLGFGVFTATIARWRLLPDLSFPMALRISAFVSVSFIIALAVICALVWLVLPMPAWVVLPALLILTSTLVLIAVSLLKPEFTVAGYAHHLPSLKTCGAIFGWTLIDTFAAALALYVLMPASAELTIIMILPAYLLALGAGLISGAPGGVGPFELALLTVLPPGTEPEILAGALAFRVIYYAIPAACAGLALARPLPIFQAATPRNSPPPQTAKRPAELGVLHQNGGKIGVFANSICALWPTPQTLCMMFDPLAGQTKAALLDLKTAAKCANKVPVLYKCKARSAHFARAAGWRVLHIADDAILRPATFDLSARPCRDLRRKMRHATREGVRVLRTTHLPLTAMAHIDDQWQSVKGGARGGSMGRFSPDYLSKQHVFLAHHNGVLVGYISLHTTPDEWCLDLMRHSTDAPSGTMQMLITEAIAQAGRAGIPRFSLASVPSHPQQSSALITCVISRLTPFGKASGLRRFKASFAPVWEPRYVAAPGTLSLALALFDITRSIHHPPPLVNSNLPHKENEECEVAL